MIQPTVGRMILFRAPSSSKPLAATVAAVNDDGTINIGYLDSIGAHHSSQFIRIIEPGDTVGPEEHWCEWMPFQLGQAAKTEQAEAALAEKHS